MAKGKHSTALFEVIHSGKQPDRVAQRMRTPKWWFKSPLGTSGEAPEPAPVEQAGEAAAPADPEPPPRANYRSGPRSSAVHLTFDRDRHEITMRLRYTTAIVSAFGICVVIALAYVFGRHISRGPQAALASDAPPVEQPRPAWVQSNLSGSHSSRNSTSVKQPEQTHRQTAAAQPQTPDGRSTQQQASPPGVESGLPRTVNLNYIIIQSYPKEMAKTAEKARDFLIQNGIQCTLEQTDFTLKGWVSVVGTEGFTNPNSSRDCQSYKQRIEELSRKFATNKFQQFELHAYKWKGSEKPFTGVGSDSR